MFSGQGAQKVGMGREFYDNPAYKAAFDEASTALGFDLANICQNDNDKLNQTAYAQPALLTAGIASYRMLGERPDILMGLSLGEYTALCAAEAISLHDAVRLVHKRGLLMQEHGAGGMMACIMERGQVVNIVEGFPNVYCANFNAPDQVVISGDKDALTLCAKEVKAQGGKALPLKVQGGFHSPLMAAAAAAFAEVLNTVDFNKPTIPIISNVNADIIGDIKDTLVKHMTSPVKWEESVNKAISLGHKSFIELGYGNVLVKLATKINNNIQALSFEEYYGQN